MKDLIDNKKKNFWPFSKKYTMEEIQVLLESIKEFNAGAIDGYLTNHVDRCFEDWQKSYKE
jgi:hypothetical protein